MNRRFISHETLAFLVSDLVHSGIRVIAPVRAADDSKQVEYAPVTKLYDATLGTRITRRSLKDFFLPRTEVLLQYRQTKEGVEIKEVPTVAPPQVILGATPCDVAGLGIVDKVMGWDYKDELWFGRREATTIVSLLCTVMDETCFCTAVGLGPDSAHGSDMMLFPVEGGYLTTVLTPKGEALLKRCNGADKETDENARRTADNAQQDARERVEKNLPKLPADFSAWLATHYDHPVWKTIALRCHGCSACAGVCPTCHCFDIVDEHDDAANGKRRRNWDSCQTSKFTVHASGHNPRQTQSERFRQRIEHKFSIYPTRFEEILCTGCGRCVRVCPGGMNLPEILGDLVTISKAEPKGDAQ